MLALNRDAVSEVEPVEFTWLALCGNQCLAVVRRRRSRVEPRALQRPIVRRNRAIDAAGVPVYKAWDLDLHGGLGVVAHMPHLGVGSLVEISARLKRSRAVNVIRKHKGRETDTGQRRDVISIP